MDNCTNNPRGRPKTNRPPRSAMIFSAVTDEAKNIIVDHCRRLDVTVSAYVSQSVAAALARDGIPVPPSLVRRNA